ncbi:tetratricopeptide repeat protein [Billgrantia antri]|uniref:Sel1 repeat family protein n=1 Tax=Billgrantia antri TaxID=2846777 RepID=A0ABS6ZTY6_9GAMM|nr:tetratricopeptide repeat protein [Halomonas antri]MBW6393521.1 sel1 repeat family protein [Halomonas antri]
MKASLLVAVLSLPIAAWALEPEAQAAKDEGMRLWGISEWIEMQPYLEPAAEAGDVEAMYYLGEATRLLDRGLSLRAMAWYLQAAEQGDPYAMLRLFQGGACTAGDRCPEGFEDWHHAALAITQPQAEAGDPDAMLAMYHIQRMFEASRQAGNWLERAAEAGQPEAQTLLGNQILDGRGWYLTNGRRLSAAEEWFRKAAEQEYVPGMVKLSEVLSNQERYEEAWPWTRHASRAGHLDSRLWEAFCSLDPEYDPICLVDQDIEKGWGLALSVIEETSNDTARWVLEENNDLLVDRRRRGAEQVAEEWIGREPPLSNFPPRFGY